jgi:glycosyltransferase involved in cell wall biosynthesis
MKIVYVSDAIYPYNKGGKEKRLYELSTRLAQSGHDVHIYTMHWWPSIETTSTEDGVQLHAICKLYPLYSGDKRSVKEGLLFGFACLRLMSVQFDVLDVDHMPFFPIYSAWIVCWLRGRRFYGTWHEALSRSEWISYMGQAGNIAAAIERISVRLPFTVTAASAHTQSLIKSKLGRTRRVALVASGIDSQQISTIKASSVRCDVLYAGRLVKDKNVDQLVRAIAIVAKTIPKVRCIIIGHGIEKENLAALIKELGMQQHILLLDPLAKARDVYAYMKASRVFCLPSLREGFGIVVLEALGCGTPVVTTDVPANAAKDLILEGVDGSVVSPNGASLAQALSHWISSPRPKHIKGKTAAYDWNRIAEAQAEVYAV